jgi:hypothetical protein
MSKWLVASNSLRWSSKNMFSTGTKREPAEGETWPRLKRSYNSYRTVTNHGQLDVHWCRYVYWWKILPLHQHRIQNVISLWNFSCRGLECSTIFWNKCLFYYLFSDAVATQTNVLNPFYTVTLFDKVFTIFGVLDHFWPPVVRVTPLKTPFGLLIPLLQSQSHVTTITHNYFLRCYAFTQL